MAWLSLAAEHPFETRVSLWGEKRSYECRGRVAAGGATRSDGGGPQNQPPLKTPARRVFEYIFPYMQGDFGNYCGCFHFFTSEEHRYALHIGVSIGVHGRRVPGPIVLLSVLDGRVLMVVRQQSVQFADIVVI
jgi:hypothetical protein